MSEWIKTSDRLPEKPGKASYEQIDCWVFVNGRIEQSVWNCEHECWDDADGDDYKYSPTKPTHWMPRTTPPPPEQESE